MSNETEYWNAVDVLRDYNGEPHPLAETLLAAGFVGANQRRIARLVRYPWRDTFERCRQIRKAGLFRGGRVVASDGWDNGIAFWLDVLIAEGYVERVSEEA